MLAKRPRASRPKTRTGCLTCKIRRVKCDEEKPSCQRCVSTGRRCDGYSGSQVASKAPSPVSPVTPLSVVIGGNEQERMLFHYFEARCVAHLAGSFDKDFWQHSVLQYCYHEPAIRHSIFALASWHKAFSFRKTAIVDREAAVRHYIQGIQCLQRRIDEGQPRCNELALMACVILMACDALRGNFQGSLTHLLSGSTVLSSAQEGSGASSSTRTESSELRQLANIFSCLKVHAASFAAQIAAQVEHVPVLPNRFSLLSDMRNYLNQVLGISFYWLRCKGEPSKYQKSRSEDLLMQQGAVISLMNQWLVKAKLFESEHGQVDDISHLRMQCLATKIRIQQVLNPDESSYDEYLSEFREIVHLATSSLGGAIKEEDIFGFRAHRGVVQPLYFTACKCRYPLVRRRATALLPRAGIEGVWNGRIMAAVAEHVIKSEESGLLQGLTSEQYRIHGTSFDFNIGTMETQTSTISSSRMTADGGWNFEDVQVSW